MKIRGHDIGVCSWSIQPKSMTDLIGTIRQIGLEHVQLALGPLLDMPEEQRASELALLRDSGLKLTATMISFPGEDYTTIAIIRRTGGLMPDEAWPLRKELAIRAGKLSAELGVRFLTFHVGFVPPSSDPVYNTIVERVREIAQALASLEVSLLMETGQEEASELLQFINDLNCRNVGVNFDPANMILYGSGDPIDAIGMLNRHIQHVHVKDAIASEKPRTDWGREVPFGAGDVGPEMFLDALDEIGYAGPLVIEREAGSDRVAAIKAAVKAIQEAE